ncbi:MAG TPA: quinoprotein relay system zinc metallohydrolase 2 [Methylibium sp.]|uniref:quinoprotein relay system zinc metallohydrolase 2 n=1 Tax=Methylibium sp. TaxID=2067992 RepID=UPI002DBA923C|nr:quinoprotein relay system zinc metallohydrolase 2 [Methylibium sp.]HEU4460937.1 quinoprotein relay system zinc metallohydrolase 2 [Methylibium sp.]
MAWALAGCAGPRPASTQAVFTELAAGTYLHRGLLEDWGPANLGDVADTGLVIGSRCAAVIDTGGTLATGRKLAAAVRRLTDKPVCWVIATHAHPDHVLGHQAFVEAAVVDGQPPPVIVGHARLPAALAVRGPYYLNALKRDFGPALAEQTALLPPTLSVQATLELDLGGRVLELKAWPTAHTDADLSVFDRASGTLFVGDLLFVDHTPVIDGRLKGWLAAMDDMQTWPVKIAVPGHGPPSPDWPGVLAPQRRYLEGLRSDVRAAIKEGLTLRQAVERIAPDRADWQLLDVFHARNVTAAYAELEWDE